MFSRLSPLALTLYEKLLRYGFAIFEDERSASEAAAL